ncbi:Coproporphyrinogen-III oxidase [Paramarasmius palmivorus]|uniref:coproporphyrinogen oxidase n=1 Tax=Paramarasmius palmivorus TaxID=297713 RepID=A0AAW0CEP2_9AGAR
MSTQPPMRTQVESYIRNLQSQIVSSLESLDPSAPAFVRDSWIRPEGGSGQSCVFSCPPVPSSQSPTQETETILEKAGVNISIVHGSLPPAAVKQMRADHSTMPEISQGSLPFFAAGISLVIHPRNPHAPTVHANYRYFELTEGEGEEKEGKVLAWWFGGGADLTPSYLYDEDAIHFHTTLKDACTAGNVQGEAGNSLYNAIKKWCDEYFYIPHRKETRGVGGIFFDDLNEGKHARLPEEVKLGTQDDIFKLIQSLGNAFVPSYIPILSRRARLPYTDHQRRWQLLRRGRYVEFNLVYDRGTKFGLMTPGARVESILMSLPEVARWEYMSKLPEEGSEEERLMKVLNAPREWVGV